ncbi:MAG: formylmethanofuran dehydrogenase subunit C [Gammaproteobacteria bacterium]
MKLRLHTLPEVPMEAEVISPDALMGLSTSEAAALPVYHGNRKVSLGDFFELSGQVDESDPLVEVEGDLSRVKLIGHSMSGGRLVIHGSVGAHLGAAMKGGEIQVYGNAADWVGREMVGGRIVINGNAGHMVGSAVRGSSAGVQGGEIIIHGNALNEVGNGMRRGLIAIGGNTNDFTGVNMLAGTIIVLGRLGMRPGAGMKRGSIIAMERTEVLPTFTYNSTIRPDFIRFYLFHLRKLGMGVRDEAINGQYERWSGDSLELNKGEILMLAG